MIWKRSQKRAWFAFWLNVNWFHAFIFLDHNSCLNFRKQQLLSSEEKPIEAFFFKLNLHKKKWFVCCSYNRNKSNISRHLDTLRKSLDLCSPNYENTILIVDFKVSIDDPHMESFCESYWFKNPTCLKNPESPSCTDLILTNNLYSFQNSWVIETGLSDFHKMIVSVMKTTF